MDQDASLLTPLVVPSDKYSDQASNPSTPGLSSNNGYPQEFDSTIHFKADKICVGSPEFHKIDELRELLETDNTHYKSSKDVREYYESPQILQHFLIARQYNLKNAYKMISSAIEWRMKRNPKQWFSPCLSDKDVAIMSKESETGKIRLEGRDRYDREVIVFDNRYVTPSPSLSCCSLTMPCAAAAAADDDGDNDEYTYNLCSFSSYTPHCPSPSSSFTILPLYIIIVIVI